MKIKFILTDDYYVTVKLKFSYVYKLLNNIY